MDKHIWKLKNEINWLEWAIAHNQQTIAKIHKELEGQVKLASHLRMELAEYERTENADNRD